MKFTNNEEHSLSIAVWLVTDRYNHNRYPGKKHMSATGLLKPTRMSILGKQASKVSDKTELDISMNIPNRMGTAIHSGIEFAWLNNHKQALLDLGYPETVVNRVIVNPTPEELKAVKNPIPVYIEKRTHKEFMGYVIDGEFDFCGEGILEDFKSTGVYSYIHSTNDEKHMLQGSIYRWLNQDIITKNFMRIQYAFTDWSKLQAMIRAKSGYPQSRVVTKKLDLLSIKDTEAFIREKLTELDQYANTPEAELPECPKDELWQSETVWKFYKDPAKTKRSSGNFNTYAEAHAKLVKFGSKGTIKEFPGQVRRCGYCNAYDLCTQKNTYLEKGILALP